MMKHSGLTETEFQSLALAKTDADFASAANVLGVKFAGPSLRGSILALEPNGKAWLFSRYQTHGRTYAASVWTADNVECMGGVRNEVIKNDAT